MVPGLHPREASERLTTFQAQFDELWAKYQTYSGGEKLFGMSITEYPALVNVRKELGLLQKLYGLYNTVIDTIDSYYDILWTEVRCSVYGYTRLSIKWCLIMNTQVNIEKINTDLIEFQNRCRKLPKGLKEWQAFIDLKKKIDDFNETCPLLELMANKAMKDRHWERIAQVTGIIDILQ